MRPVNQVDIARVFGVTKHAVIKWRTRYADFPKPVTTDPYPRYDLGEVEKWFATRWPERVGVRMGSVRVHHYHVSDRGLEYQADKVSGIEYARGYLTALRGSTFADWRCFYTRDGFSAHRGNETHVYVIDPTTSEPDPWYVYDARFKATGKAA